MSVAAVADSGEARSLPAVVDRGEGLLSIRLARGPKGSARINLELNVPERAHLSIATSDGPIDVRGLPAALLAQSVSAEIHIELPRNAEATVVADSKTGSVCILDFISRSTSFAVLKSGAGSVAAGVQFELTRKRAT